MNDTIAYYNNHAEDFIASTFNADMSYCRERFLKYIPAGGKILDAGCGECWYTEELAARYDERYRQFSRIYPALKAVFPHLG